MHKIVFGLLLGLYPCTAQAQLFSEAVEPWTPYLSGTVQGAFLNANSGGFNTVGPHANFGSDRSDVAALGGAVGLSRKHDLLRTRVEVEGMWYADQDIVTSSFPGPPGPASFFYETEITDSWSVLSNLWLDLFLTDRLAWYAGGGIGAAGARMRTNDSVVTGSGADANFAWQAGTGLLIHVGNRVDFDLGYRYVDLGETRILLDFGQSSAGTYKIDRTTHNLTFTVRLYLY